MSLRIPPLSCLKYTLFFSNSFRRLLNVRANAHHQPLLVDESQANSSSRRLRFTLPTPAVPSIGVDSAPITLFQKASAARSSEIGGNSS